MQVLKTEKINIPNRKIVEKISNRKEKMISYTYLLNNVMNEEIQSYNKKFEYDFQYYYVENKIVLQNNKKYLYLKREEHTLKNKEIITDNFYDCLFIEDEHLIFMLNDKKDTYFTDEQLLDYKNYEFTILNCDLFKEKHVLFKESLSNRYYYYEGTMLNLKGMENIYTKHIVKKYCVEKNISFLNFKLRKKIKRKINDNGIFYKSIYFFDIVKHMTLFKTYFIEYFKLPTYYLNKDLYSLLHDKEFPAFENTWFKFDSATLCNKNVMQLFFKENNLLDRDFYSVRSLYQNVQEENLKNSSILFKKEINSLLKEKVTLINTNIFYNEINNLNFLLLFEDENHLKNFLNNITEKEFTINYLKHDLFPSNIMKDNTELFVSDIKKMFQNKFVSYDIIEKGFIQLYKDVHGLKNFVSHLNDMVSMLYTFNKLFESTPKTHRFYKEFEEFYHETFYSFKKFEKKLNDIYINITFKEEDIKKIKENKQLKMLDNNDFYFKQPTDSLELKKVGKKMHHCVYSYHNSLLEENREREIVVMYDKKTNEPIVCIELKSKKNSFTCRQSKLKYNKPSKTTPNYNEFVLEFLDLNQVIHDTSDI